jgi:hypothetical protein
MGFLSGREVRRSGKIKRQCGLLLLMQGRRWRAEMAGALRFLVWLQREGRVCGCCLGVAAGVEKSKAKGGGRRCLGFFLGFFCGLGFFFCIFLSKLPPLYVC